MKVLASSMLLTKVDGEAALGSEDLTEGSKVGSDEIELKFEG